LLVPGYVFAPISSSIPSRQSESQPPRAGAACTACGPNVGR